MAWGDGILASLPQRAKVRFAGGRWLRVEDGTAVFGLPNPVHAQRCEECRVDVEAALAAHFGTTVPVRLVVDEHAEAPAAPGAPPPAAPTVHEDPEDIDVADLADADDVADTGLDRIAAVFPGAELVDEGPDRLL
jgi:DNA polymerase III subunit gamma/tau